MEFKKGKYYESGGLNMLQYFFAIAIVIMFIISLLPGTYDDIYHIVILFILIQFLISVFRFRIINILFEIILLVLSLLLSIPIMFAQFKVLEVLLSIALYFLLLIAIPIALLDMTSFKGNFYYEKMEYFTTNKRSSGTKKTKVKKNKKFESDKIKDAEFEEK